MHGTQTCKMEVGISCCLLKEYMVRSMSAVGQMSQVAVHRRSAGTKYLRKTLCKVSLTGYIIAKAYGGECHYNKVDGFQLAPALHVGKHEGRREDKEQAANQQEEHCRQHSHQPRWHMPLLWGRVVDRAIEMPVTYSSILSPHPTPILTQCMRGSCSLGVHTRLPGTQGRRPCEGHRAAHQEDCFDVTDAPAQRGAQPVPDSRQQHAKQRDPHQCIEDTEETPSICV